ncbi:ester cyclase [filamentous cyanobacterium CCP3]|nr:ester cyclase [filamentous cyanobacterium CCP3]
MADLEIQNLAVAHRYVEQFLGKGDISIAEEIFDEKIQVITGLKPTGAINGIEEYKQVFSGFYDAFPDVKPLAIQDSFATGDRVVVRFKSFQKHVKDYFGIPKSDRVITFHETHVMRLANGKVIENIVSATNLEFEMLMAPVLAPLILT